MRMSSNAKRPASSPPAPGRISIRQGSSPNGCRGIRDSFKAEDMLDKLDLVDVRSSAARSRSSLSVEGSWRRDLSSVTD